MEKMTNKVKVCGRTKKQVAVLEKRSLKLQKELWTIQSKLIDSIDHHCKWNTNRICIYCGKEGYSYYD